VSQFDALRSDAPVRWPLAILFVTGCGEPAALPDAAELPSDALPPDPFAGMFDDPSDFPHQGCTPGSVDGFALAELWPTLGLRTSYAGQLETYAATYLDEEHVPHILTADDLMVRNSHLFGSHWELNAIDVCSVGADGTLFGYRAACAEPPPGFPDTGCSAFSFTAKPLHRIAGETEGLHLALLGEIGGAWPHRVGENPSPSSNVRVDGDFAFVSRFADGLRIVSIANPAAPVEVGHLALPSDWANDLKIVHGTDGRRYVLTASGEANIIDATNPADPQLVAQLPFYPHSVFIEGTTAYLVDGTSAAVEVWDLAKPRLPKKLGVWTDPTPDNFFSWHDVFVSGGIAYLSDINGTGMHVVDFRDPANPVILAGESAAAFSVLWHSPWLTTVNGKLLAIDGTEFSTPGMRFLDGDPASPTFLAKLGEWSLYDRESTHNVMAIGPRVYAAHYRDGVRVLDISAPASPQMIGYYNTWIEGTGTAGDYATFGIDIDPIRKRIYAADSIRGLVILQGDATVFP
jgi:hypothetical protein